jgi:hypothetical protein
MYIEVTEKAVKGIRKLDPSPELLLIHLFLFSMVQHYLRGRFEGFHNEKGRSGG